MIRRILNAPVNLYFDTTPTGRILNRFSKDIAIFDGSFPYLIGSTLVTVYTMVAILVIAIYVVPWIGLLLPILFLMTAYIYLRSIAAVKEVSRIESVTKSPLLSFLSETLSGSSTIRAFDKREEFVE